MDTVTQSQIGIKCYTAEDIKKYNGVVDINPNGVVSVYLPNNVGVLSPVQLTSECCKVLGSQYFFDIDSQKCRWSPIVGNVCGLNPFKLVLNPKGNDGTIFYIDEGQTCTLSIDFNYLFKIKCETLSQIINTRPTRTRTYSEVPIEGPIEAPIDNEVAINARCKTPIEFFETFNVSATLDLVTGTTVQTVATFDLFNTIGNGQLYNYLVAHPENSGFYVCGDNDTTCTPLTLDINSVNTYACDEVMNNLLTSLYAESGLSGTTNGQDTFTNTLPVSGLASKWLHFNTLVTDQDIIALIKNQKIKISFEINHACGDFCVLVDEIVLDKNCTQVSHNNIFITQSPGFQLDRIIDNKKSWIANTAPTNRPFVISNNLGNNSIRQTNYDVNDERLVINTKEIDLDINLASAIETDVWCYINDNPCLLTGITSCLPCIEICGDKNFQDDECFSFMDGKPYNFMDGLTTGGGSLFNHANCCGDDMIDFASLMTQSLSAVTIFEDFEYFLTSELIDAKNRQTISGYPTLRALYNRYMNSGLYCGNESSKFDYVTMDQFAGLIDNYWVDIVEQVVPATTIWGSVKIYSNTVFDQQKYKYKSYSSLFCGNQFSGTSLLSPINGSIGVCSDVEVVMTPLNIQSNPNVRIKNRTTRCNSICVAQMNSGSEFVGTIQVVKIRTGGGKNVGSVGIGDGNGSYIVIEDLKVPLL